MTLFSLWEKRKAFKHTVIKTMVCPDVEMLRKAFKVEWCRVLLTKKFLLLFIANPSYSTATKTILFSFLLQCWGNECRALPGCRNSFWHDIYDILSEKNLGTKDQVKCSMLPCVSRGESTLISLWASMFAFLQEHNKKWIAWCFCQEKLGGWWHKEPVSWANASIISLFESTQNSNF